jgi:hypothetical protein
MGYTFGAASEYDKPVPVDSRPLLAPATKSRSSNTIQDIAQELVENTLGVEMLGQADKVEPEKLKKAFYKALSSAFGSSSKTIAAPQQSVGDNSKAQVAVQSSEQDFLAIATSIGTYKVQANRLLPKCIIDENKNGCAKKGCKNVRCIPYGHFYDTLYQSQLGHLSRSDAEPFQALELASTKDLVMKRSSAGCQTPKSTVWRFLVFLMAQWPRGSGLMKIQPFKINRCTTEQLRKAVCTVEMQATSLGSTLFGKII